MAAFPAMHATSSGVWPFFAAAFTSTPRLTKSATASGGPTHAVMWSSVWPFGSVSRTSAPLSSSACIEPSRPNAVAIRSGVAPFAVLAFGLAPRASSRLTTAGSGRPAA